MFRPALGPTQFSIQWVPNFFPRGWIGWSVKVTPHCRGYQWVELYLCSVYTPSWRRQGQLCFTVETSNMLLRQSFFPGYEHNISFRPSRLSPSHCIYFRISPHFTSLLVSLLPLTVHPFFPDLPPMFTSLFSLCWQSLFCLSPVFFIVPTFLFWLRIIRPHLCFYLWNLRNVICVVVMEDRALTRLSICGKQREDLWDRYGRYECSHKILVGETEEKKPTLEM